MNNNTEYFKIIKKEYVIENTILNTKQYNYGKVIINKEFEILKPFLKTICELDQIYDFGLDLYICLYNNVFYNGEKYFNYIVKKYGNDIDLCHLTDNDHKSKTANIKDLKKIIQVLQKSINIDTRNIRCLGTYLSEYIFENERIKNFNNIISRLDSFFVFNNMKSVEYYINRWNIKSSTLTVRIIPIEIYSSFSGDIKYIDDIKNETTINDYITIANRYWGGKNTSDPIIETFFQGKFKMEIL